MYLPNLIENAPYFFSTELMAESRIGKISLMRSHHHIAWTTILST